MTFYDLLKLKEELTNLRSSQKAILKILDNYSKGSDTDTSVDYLDKSLTDAMQNLNDSLDVLFVFMQIESKKLYDLLIKEQLSKTIKILKLDE